MALEIVLGIDRAGTYVYNVMFETYRREVELEVYMRTGAMDDQEVAKADAIGIAEKG